MKLDKWLAGLVALVCAGQADAVTYYHMQVDFAIHRVIGPAGGGAYEFNEGTRVELNLTSDPSQPAYYYGPGADFLAFTIGNAAIILQYDLAELNASSSTHPISSPDFNVIPLFGARETATLIGASNSAYASNQSTGPLGISISPGSAPALPETAAWMTMIVGFGLVGSGMRFRRARAEVRFA